MKIPTWLKIVGFIYILIHICPYLGIIGDYIMILIAILIVGIIVIYLFLNGTPRHIPIENQIIINNDRIDRERMERERLDWERTERQRRKDEEYAAMIRIKYG